MQWKYNSLQNQKEWDVRGNKNEQGKRTLELKNMIQILRYQGVNRFPWNAHGISKKKTWNNHIENNVSYITLFWKYSEYLMWNYEFWCEAITTSEKKVISPESQW